MSPFDGLTPFKVKVKSSDRPDAPVIQSAKLTIFDSEGTEWKTNNGKVTTELLPGLYTARIEYLGSMREEVIIHRNDTDQTVLLPKRNSAMPMADTKFTHEYLEKAAQIYSVNSTFEQINTNKLFSRLMIMIRKIGDNKDTKGALLPKAVLLDEQGIIVSELQQDETFPEEPKTFIVYSALLEPGNYILSVESLSQMQMLPISLFSGWDTFIFVPYQNGLRLSSTSIKVVEHDKGYHPNDELSAQIDAALLGLGSRLDLLDDDLRQIALYGKFNHPFIGLIGAHSHFRGSNRKQRLESQVLFNLWNLLPGSTDVIALLLMSLEYSESGIPSSIDKLDQKAEQAFDTKISHLLPLSFPPMLNSSLETILRATINLPMLIKDDSWIEAAGNSSCGSNLWSVWKQPGRLYSVLSADSIDLPNGPELSTQKLYPAVKKAISAASNKALSEINANTRLIDIFKSSQSVFQNIEYIIGMVELDLSDFKLDKINKIINTLETVRDFVKQVQLDATPIFAEKKNFKLQKVSKKFSPSFEIDDWLIELVHEKIKDNNLDIGQFSKIYSVSRNTIEKALMLERPSNDDIDISK